MRMAHLWLLMGLFAFGCAGPPVFVHHKDLNTPLVTRVSFRPYGNTIYSTPYIGNPNVLPAGLPAKVTKFSDREVHIEIDQIPYVMEPIDGLFNTNDIEGFLIKYFTPSKEDLRMEEMDQEMLQSALAGTALVGMPKEMVLMALGMPAEIDLGTPTINVPLDRILKSNRWTYRVSWILGFATKQVYTFYDGKLKLVQ